MNLLSISTDKNIFDKNSAVFARQIEYAKKLNHLHIIVLSNKKFKDLHFENISIYSTNSRNKISSVFDAIKIGKKIENIDEITCQDPFECGYAGYKLKRSNQKIEFQIHTDLYSPNFTSLKLGIKLCVLNFIRQRIANFLLPKADRIRVVSKMISDSLEAKSWKPKATIEIRPIQIDINKIINTKVNVDLHKKYPQFEKIILMASRLSPEKNIGLAIDVFSKFIKKYPKTGLLIVGSGQEKESIKHKVESKKISDSVILEDWQNQETIYSYYKTADLFLNTSLYEGYGMTLVEAKTAGCKIVSTDVGVARELNISIVATNRSCLFKAIIEAIY